MGRSYFSQILRGSADARLRPPRPTSNLWKSARIDWLGAQTPLDAPEGETFVSRRPSAPAVATEIELPAASTVQPKPAPVSLRPAQTSRSNEHAQAAARNEPPREAAVIRPAAAPPDAEPSHSERAHEAAPPKNNEPRSRHQWSSSPKSSSSLQAASDRPQRAPQLAQNPQADFKVRPMTAPMALAPADAKATATPAPFAAKPATIEAPPPAIASLASLAPRAAPQAVTPAPLPPQSLPARTPLEPLRHREPVAAWQPPAREEPAAGTKNGIQIGKIEVQVVPPALPRYVAPAMPRGRLARGYSLWSSWQ
jgi:hypothetical protein